MIRKGLKPSIKPALEWPGDGSTYRRVFRIKRYWPAIAVLAVFDLIFMVPAITTFTQAAAEWSQFDDLFDLVAALFLSAWLLGWSIAPLLMSAILVMMLFGREVIKVRDDKLLVFLGLPGIGVQAEYAISAIRNPRFERPLKKSGKAWRGPHMAFDYGANNHALGCNISGDDMIEIKHRIETASGQSMRRGEATDDEINGSWRAAVTPSRAAVLTAEPTPSANVAEPLALGSPSTLLLIIANLVPFAGAMFLDWNLGNVMVLYWAESAVIGFFNICKIIVIGRWFAFLAAPFFAGHFGGFMAIHFLFIYSLFIKGPQDTGGADLAEVMQMFSSLLPALAILFISHAFSFFNNFMGRREYLGRTVNNQMSEPYRRIIFMHLSLILGGGLTLILGESRPVLLVIIAVKVWLDLRAHLGERGQKTPASV